MTENKPAESPWDDRKLDQALSELRHEVPDEFSARVMQSIAVQDTLMSYASSASPAATMPPLNRLQWCALVGGGLLGVGQIARIIFGLWFTATAW